MYSHQNVTLRGFHWEASSLTFNLNAAITKDTPIGSALTVDAAAPNTMKLAGDGDPIVGRLASFENREVEGTKVGAVELQWSNVMPIAAGATVNVGDTVVGAGDGEVKAAAAADYTQNFVAEVIGTMAVVVKV
ncbi:hypothetical protein JYP52_01385 [Nitratireductor aquibiodomus]|uniref:hypothetical protein n=1 Tax=Nitratireductor TaxID=245876 RepID=UPI0019D3E646|nr:MULTISPECIES: hypothetical protein [Nitratireductor]MBN7759775.1 hypothetical protein [Nitratireductor aquibiodomus]MCV0350198.1 hypothetical protein [Nitratireductor sp.]MDV2968703.1 hypothetical protein [Nitratireductor aquimarinus]